MFKNRFITDLGEKNLLTYKYFGTDHSLLYKHVYSPLAQRLVDKVFPTWLAPNLITLIGLAATLIPHIILWFMFPTRLFGPVPGWLCFLAGFGQLFYIIFDNADGKQARRTGTSSPLGLLFDHGCDALNTFIAGLTFISVAQCDNSLSAMVSYLIVMIPFYMATWEEYYTEHLTLPIVNGPNEGITGVIVLYVVTGLIGNHIWTEKIGSFSVNTIALALFTLMAISNILINIAVVIKKMKKQSILALFNLSALVYIVASVLIVATLSPTDVVTRQARYIIYFFGLSFSTLVGHLQVSHVTQDRYNQFEQSVMLPITLLNMNTLLGYFTGRTFIDEDILIYILCTVSLLVYINFATNVLRHFKRVLKVDIFHIRAKEGAKTQ